MVHRAARRSLGVALVSVSNLVREDVGDVRLAERLNVVATKCIRVRFAADEQEWVAETGRLSGVWAHRIENDLSNDEQPSSGLEVVRGLFHLLERHRQPRCAPLSGIVVRRRVALLSFNPRKP